VYENMSPERGAEPGSPSKADFVGWGGIGPCAVLLEYVFGLRLDVPAATLVWDLRLASRFGVHRLPFGKGGLLHVECAPRARLGDPPQLWVRSTLPLAVVVTWGRGASAAGGVANAARAEGPVWRAAARVEASWDAAAAEAFPEGERISAAGAPLALGQPELVAAAGDAGAEVGSGGGGGGGGGEGGAGGSGGSGGTPGARPPSPLPALVGSLADMGFSEADARAALRATGGDLNAALERLTGSF